MTESIRAVERALEVLSCFSVQRPELTLTQISEQVGINKSTVHRLLGTLEKNRFVERDSSTGAYHPGIRLLQLAYLSLENNDLRRLAAPFMHSLCEDIRENANLALLDDTDVVYLDVVESAQRVKLAATSGQRLPAFCTASGKAILAFSPDEIVKKVLVRGLPQYTPYTIATHNEFLNNLRQVQKIGFAIAEQELEEGINAVAAPIFNSSNFPIASLSIAGPAYRLTRDRLVEIGPEVVRVSTLIAQEVEKVK